MMSNTNPNGSSKYGTGCGMALLRSLPSLLDVAVLVPGDDHQC